MAGAKPASEGVHMPHLYYTRQKGLCNLSGPGKSDGGG